MAEIRVVYGRRTRKPAKCWRCGKLSIPGRLLCRVHAERMDRIAAGHRRRAEETAAANAEVEAKTAGIEIGSLPEPADEGGSA